MTRASILCLALGSCGIESTPKVKFATGLPKAETYYPMVAGYTWTFDIEPEEGEPFRYVSRVMRRDGAKAIVMAGDRQAEYKIADDGVQSGAGWYLYKWPPQLGDTWQVTGGHARVISTQGFARTAYGYFTNCLVVEEWTGNKLVTTSYAPNVGPVKIEVFTGDGGHVHGELSSFTKGNPLLEEE